MIELPENPYSYPQYTEQKAYDISQRDTLRRVVEEFEECQENAVVGFRVAATEKFIQELVNKLAELERR